MTNKEAIAFFEGLLPGNAISEEATRLAIEALKEQQPKKGHWIKDYTFSKNKSHPRIYCSECKGQATFMSRYCCECGSYNKEETH